MISLLKSAVIKSRVLKHFRRNQLIIFNYHRIKDASKPVHFDDNVYGPDAARFREEVTWMKNETRVLSESELIDILYNKKEISEICSMITFDDGYIDNYEIAYPILKELNLPATFFIPTWSISERKLGWWDIVSFLIKETKEQSFIFREKIYFINDRPKLIQHFITELKKMEPSRVNRYLADLATSLKCEMPTKEMQSHELMTWDQLREMSRNGMTIGSHTHDHVILSKQNIKQMREQVDKSLLILERELGKKIESLAYPVGEYDHFDYDTKKVMADSGLKIALSYRTGVNYGKEIDPFDVKRVPVARHWKNLDLPLALPKIAFPFLMESTNGH